MGGLFAVYEGIQKLRHPHEPADLGIAVAILLFALVLEGLSLRTAVREARHHKHASTSWWGFIHRTKQPELPVVLLEDGGACVGLLFALGGVVLSVVTGEPRWDALGSIAIGTLLIAIAIVLMFEMKSLLIGEGASRDVLARITQEIEGAPDVEHLIHLRTEHLGPDEILVTTKVEFASSLTYAELVAALDRTEDAVRRAVPQVTIMYVEPDIDRPGRA
jgi:divalent metal cation (Fe/Co/Zn/Cd) transporter